MAYNFKTFDDRSEEVLTWLSNEYGSIRTGQATPALLDSIQVESYGARVPLNQVGTVGVEDARTLRVNSWDKGAIQSIEKSINDADLGVSVAVDDAGLRVIFPELTSDRRDQLLKIAKSKLEDARVSLRGARDELMKQVEKDHKDGEISEDDKFNVKEELQKKIDAKNEALNEMYTHKEQEINQ